MINREPKKGFGFIYKYTSPSGKSYIGQTIQTLSQRAGINGKNYKKCIIFYKAIQKYGFEKFDIEILAEAPIKELNVLEIKYIEIFQTRAPNGYNIAVGGKGGATKNVYQYNENGKLIKEYSSINEAASANNLTLQSMSSILHGTTQHCSQFFFSFEQFEQYPIKEICDNHDKLVYMYDKNNNLIKTFNSIGKAAEYVNGERSAIKRCCRNELKTAYGYCWQCSELLLEKKYNNTPRPINQLDKETLEIIKTFPSISSAIHFFNKNGSGLIRKALNDNKYSAYGYKWEYAQSSTTKYS